MQLGLVVSLLVAAALADRVFPRVSTSWPKQSDYYILDTFRFFVDRSFAQHSQIAVGGLIYAEEAVSNVTRDSSGRSDSTVVNSQQEEFMKLKTYAELQFDTVHSDGK